MATAFADLVQPVTYTSTQYLLGPTLIRTSRDRKVNGLLEVDVDLHADFGVVEDHVSCHGSVPCQLPERCAPTCDIAACWRRNGLKLCSSTVILYGMPDKATRRARTIEIRTVALVAAPDDEGRQIAILGAGMRKIFSLLEQAMEHDVSSSEVKWTRTRFFSSSRRRLT